MRITSGVARGRKVRVPVSRGTRPTSEKVRQAIFSILGDQVVDACVLDLFAGSGGMGLEALSRNARFVVFVDKSRKAIETIRLNTGSLNFQDRVNIWQGESQRYLRKAAHNGLEFDIIFLDPDYGHDIWKEAMLEIVSRDLLASGGIIVLETWRKEAIPSRLDSLNLVSERLYGDTKITFWQIANEVVQSGRTT